MDLQSGFWTEQSCASLPAPESLPLRAPIHPAFKRDLGLMGGESVVERGKHHMVGSSRLMKTICVLLTPLCHSPTALLSERRNKTTSSGS